MAVQQGRSDERTGGVALSYVEDAFEARTMLANFFSILLDVTSSLGLPNPPRTS